MRTQLVKGTLFILLIGIFISCDTNKVLDDFNIRVSPNMFEHAASIAVFDAVDSTALNDVTITIDGDYSDDIYTIFGERDFKVEQGFLEIGLHRRANPLPGDPVLVHLYLSSPGYLPRHYSLEFSEDEELVIVDIPMINISAPPAGVKFISNSESLSGGTLVNPTEITIDAGPMSNQGMKINLPAGLEFFDADGNKLSGSNLEIIAGHFDTENEQSLTAFPGGFQLNSVTLPDGSVTDGNFITAGFTTMDMTVDGQEVKEFNQDITVTMNVSDQLENPETGTSLAIGDQIPIWSYDDAENAWDYEKVGTVVNGADGLELSFSTEHLSWWNLDFHRDKCCSGTACSKIRFNIPEWVNDTATIKDLMLVRISFPGTLQPINFAGNKQQLLYDGREFQMNNAPNSPVVIRVQHRGRMVANTGEVSLCGGIVNVDLSNLRPPKELVTLDVTGVCPGNPQVQIRPSMMTYYRRSGSGDSWRRLERVTFGIAATRNLRVGQTYDIGAYIGGSMRDTTITVDRLNYTINYDMGSYCDGL
jgi:hypothetical protein